MTTRFEASLDFARGMDQHDHIHKLRNEFLIPAGETGELIYFCGNSLGLQPRKAREAIDQELRDWENLAIDGFVKAKNPWLNYQYQFCKPFSKIVGCQENEVTVMNTLTVNLHLMLLSFYQPAGQKYKILMESGAFPSDQYAVESQVRFYNFNPDDAIIEIGPREGEKILRNEDLISAIEENRNSLALVILGGINYYTGQILDMKNISETAKKADVAIGFDLAHAAGNILLNLHDWGADFAVWCSYKYLNGGPGSVGGVFIHEKHIKNLKVRRMGGWWGNDEKTRFEMKKGFIPKADASGWNISTAQVFNMAALKASLDIFERTSMPELRSKSIDLSGYLEFLLSRCAGEGKYEIITPKKPDMHGAQLSLFFPKNGRHVFKCLLDAGIVVDFREPGVIRVAPTPLYNTFEEVYRFFEVLQHVYDGS